MIDLRATLVPGTLKLDAVDASVGEGVRVAVIDSGVHPAHPHVGSVSPGIGFDAGGRVGGDTVDRLGHGTAVCAVIREKMPRCEIVPVKVFDRDLRTSAEALEAAIDWSVAAGAHLINLSLGTENPSHETRLRMAVERAARAGALLISAAEQEGTRWLPGSLDDAVGVLVDWACPRHTARVAITDEPGRRRRVSIQACGFPRPIPGIPPERNLKGVSFAVANATGLLGLHVAKFLRS